MTETQENTITKISELDHLLKLLDDEDESIYSNVRDRFISHGKNTSEYLKNFLNDENILIKNRANEIVSTINYENIENELKEIIGSNRSSLLEEAMFVIASFGYPALNRQEYRNKLDVMASDLRARLILKNENISLIAGTEILKTFNNYLFSDLGFKGNSENYYEADNSYLNRVIDRRKGIPITLSVIYLLIAGRLGIPVFGINLPGHFILKYKKGKEEYFIDPFNQGIVISMQEASEFIINLGMTNEEFKNIPYMKPVGDKEILLRVMRNLSEVFKREKETGKSEQIENLMKKFAE